MTLSRLLSGLLRRVGLRPPAPSSRRGRNDEDDGVGVLVSAGPRPLRGGAHARPPAPTADESR